MNKEDIPLIKLDIEGAAIEFLVDCFSKGFRPRQVLVEFDELAVPSLSQLPKLRAASYFNNFTVANAHAALA